MSKEPATFGTEPLRSTRTGAAVEAGDPLKQVSHLDFPVVGIGGSAGALPALLSLFEALPEHPGMAFVVVIHLSPDHESHIAAILGRATSMPVIQVVQRTALVQCATLFCTYFAEATSAAFARVTLARMSDARAVQMNGLGSML
ncbi:MAG: hypothetical protein H0W40_06540 [Methylibium sp.]|uniref:chemotaxis protein CheB n=1 Tax=Methylibium sp. TaxID=2067992 RepID=UPI001851C7AA|nr:chemotaxis protein CheB [Methylibium sp.]MBA3597018.1 hypothetical protein [Methylibium sp.]